VITLYRQKSADQMAQDQQNGQKTMADLQSQISSLRIEMNKCQASITSSTKSGNDCAAISAELADAIQKQGQANQQMSPFAKADNATLSDLKAGMQITVYGEKINQTGSQPAGYLGNFVDISQSLKFNVSALEVREMLAAPTAPAAPAAATTPAN
jgi:paraquat-inducible protein B